MAPTFCGFLLMLLALENTQSFAPRPGLGRQTLYRSSISTHLQASTLKEVEAPPPFFANEVSPQQALSDSYQQQQGSSIQVKKDDDNKFVEFGILGTWITGLSSFLLINNFVGPWPAALLQAIPVKAFGLTHAVAGMLFGGGIILTTLIEWLATNSKNASVLNFYFDKVPALDSLVVLPALTASIVSGVGLAVDHYDSLGQAPFHVVGAISTLLAFAIWWAATDLTTQGAAMEAIQEWTRGDTETTDVPSIVQFRKLSNVVSCLFVAALYGFMVLKPGYTPPLPV